MGCGLAAAGKQTGGMMGGSAGCKRNTSGEINIFRLRDGLVIEHWHQFEQMTMMKQLGAMPGGGKSGANGANAAEATAEAGAEAAPSTGSL